MASASGRQRRAADQPVTAEALPEAEHRHLSVLLCEIVESTPLSHRLDAEDLRRVTASASRAVRCASLGNA
jgi:hypothetical protein